MPAFADPALNPSAPSSWRQPVRRVLGSSAIGLLAASTGLGVVLASEAAVADRNAEEALVERVADDVEAWVAQRGTLPGDLADVYGGAPPVSPWGHPLVLVVDDLGAAIVSLGADGQPGGWGDASDLAVPLRAPAADPARHA